jgi:CubicO group peptidase (beta-lactamase class C family)
VNRRRDSSEVLVRIFLLLGLLLSAEPLLSAAWSPTEKSLQAAADYSRARRGFALLIMQNDRVIFEDYENGAKPNEAHKIYSGTKGFWTVAAMCAVEDGLLKLDELAADTITEWRGDSEKSRITIRQLLNFTAGIDPGFHLHSDELRDRNSFALNLPSVAAPGESFIYGPGQLQIFSEILRRKLLARGGEKPFHYLQRRVLNPLGLGEVVYKKDALGNPLLATGFQLSTRQWARFGAMLLHSGNYENHQIVPQTLLKQCFEGSPANAAFGMGFWTNAEAPREREINIEDELELKWWEQRWNHVCICRDAPRDMIVALGSGYQRLYVIPSLGLIIVRQGLDAKFSDSDFLRLIFNR